MPRPYTQFPESKTVFGALSNVEPRRRSIRLFGFDYSTPGAYFVTICTRDRQPIGDPAREVVTACWTEIPTHFPNVTLDAFVVMPDHLHGVLILEDVGSGMPDPSR